MKKAAARPGFVAVDAVKVGGSKFIMRLNHRLMAGPLGCGDLRLRPTLKIFDVVL